MTVNLHDERLKNPDFLESLFADLGYCNIRKHRNYLSFGRSQDSSPKSITAYFNKDKTFVNDHPRDIKGDLITYIHEAHDLSISQTIRLLEKHAGIELDNYSVPFGDLFGGFFRNRYRGMVDEDEPLEHSLLDQYETIPNTRFLKDHISLKAQSYFEIGYDAKRDMITIPIYSAKGDLIGVKARANYPTGKGRNKYIFLEPCSQSSRLYGYYQNRSYMENGTVFIFEAEKSVMQAFSYGYRNAVAIGSSSLSEKQISLIAKLNPQKVVLLLDQGLHPRIIEDNLRKLSDDLFLEGVPLYYWDYREATEKSSPTDSGKEQFEHILESKLIKYREGSVSENLTF